MEALEKQATHQHAHFLTVLEAEPEADEFGDIERILRSDFRLIYEPDQIFDDHRLAAGATLRLLHRVQSLMQAPNRVIQRWLWGML